MANRANVIKVAIIGDESSLDRATAKAKSHLKSLDSEAKSSAASMSSRAKAIGAAMAGGALAIATIAIKNGDALNESEDQLSGALDNMHQHVKNLGQAIDPLQSQMEKWGYTNAQVDDGLAKLVRSGDKLTTATKDEALAANIAKGRHIDLAAAEDLLVKVRTGHVALLGRYGIATKDATGKTISITAAVGKLTAMYKGSANRAAQSMAGKTAALKAKFTDMTAHLGQKLIPILLHLGVILGNVIGFFERNRAALVALVAVVGTFVAATTTMFIIDKVRMLTEAWTVAQKALNASFLANPIVLVVAAIAALAAGVFLAYKKVKWFHDAVDAVWQGLQAGYHWVTKNWPLLLGILTGPFGLAVLAIVKNRDAIIGAIQAIPGKIAGFASHMWSGITGAFDSAVHWIGQRGSDIVGFIAGLPALIGKAGRWLVSAITAPFRAAFDFVARMWNDTIGKVHFSVPSWVPLVGGDGWGFPQMPTFHSGGVFDSRSSRGEGFAFLRDGEGVFTPEQMRALGSMAFAGGGNRGGTTTVHVNMPAGVDPTAVVRATRRWEKRNGKGL